MPQPSYSSSLRLIRFHVMYVALALVTVVPATAATPFQVTPAEVQLRGNFSRVQLLVTALAGDGKRTERSADLTSGAQYTSSNPEIVSFDDVGRLVAVGNGQATISVTVDGQRQEVPVTVSEMVADPQVQFIEQVNPIITKAGCNMGSCHASQHGKGGFTLSVLGFDPDKDRDAIVRDRQQRRVNLINPQDSLILQKPTTRVPHSGGRRLRQGSVDYQVLLAWLKAGAPAPVRDAPRVTKLTVMPTQRIGQAGEKQQLRVEAQYSNGITQDVTALAKYDSMDEGLLAVTESGMVTALDQGQAPIMIRFEGQAEVSTFVIPYSQSVQLADWQNHNFVDELAAVKFRELGIEPSPLCDDATFVRRAYLDAIGTVPTIEDTLEFVQSTEPQKREQLIDRLLGLTGDPNIDQRHTDQYAAFWTLKWSDLIRNNSNTVGEQGMWALHNWIKESFRTNRPFDQFVRELVTGKGSIYMNGPANYFRINTDSSALTEATTQLFLGIRMECAKCHHHPFEKYSQADYYGLAAFFSRVGTKTSEEFGAFGREQVVLVRNSGEVRHPRTGKNMQPTPLEGEPVDNELDRRIPLATWLTSKDNEFFAKSIVNRYMGYLLGRGLVEPVDDMRSTNPPSNVALMNALADQFVADNYNLKKLIRTIMVSRLYQLDSQPTEQNASDRRFYSHFKVKRVAAEPLLDAIDQVTGVQTKFKSMPLGTRAIELPDAEYPNYFLKTFAKPRRASVCECERTPDENLSQALHTLNGDILANKIADKKGRIAKLLAAKKPHNEIIQELYLATLNRFPSEAEQSAAGQFLEQSPSPQECYEDLLWALINSKQFLFVR